MASNETIKQSVIAGLGIAILSQHAVAQELQSGLLVELKASGVPIVRQWFLLHPTDQPPTGAAGRATLA